MIEKSKIKKLTEQYLEGTDKYIVGVQLSTNNVIQLFIDGDKSVNISDCIALSRHLESNLDREIEDFELKVSSSGLDQPFKVFRQYLKNINREVSILLNDGKKHQGTLLSAKEDEIILLIAANKKKKIEEKKLNLFIKNIKETKSIISFKK